MRRRYVLINGGLVLALVGAAAASYLAVGNPASTTATTPTTTVARGTLTSTVSASGNLSAKTTVGVDFPANSGTVPRDRGHARPGCQGRRRARHLR